MSSANPYEPPEALATMATNSQETAHPTRMRAALAGMWRGAKLGFWTLCIVYGIIWLVVFAVAAFNPSFRSEVIRGTTAGEIALSLGKDLFFTLVFTVLHGSLPGGLIMGAIAAMRWRRPTDSENPTTLVS